MKRTSLIARTGVALVALAVSAVLTGCGGSTTTSDDQAVTSISELDSNSSASASIIGDALNKCAAKADVTINRQSAPGSAYLQKVLQQVSAKTLPDMLWLADNYLPNIAATGALAPLSDFDISTDGFAPGVLQGGTSNGKVYGLAPMATTVALFYNKDVLAKAGVQPPTTWDELEAAAAKLTSGDQYGVAFSAQATAQGSSTFLPFMWSNGGDEKNIATPQTAEALQLWVDLVKSGSASSGALNWGQWDVKDQFVAGKAAMMVNGSYAVPVLDKVSGLNYGIVKIPTKSASDTAVSPLSTNVWTVPRTGNKAKQAKAAQVVACMNSDEMQLAQAKDLGQFPTKTALAAQFASDNPQYAVFTDLLETGRAVAGELGADWPKAETKIGKALQAAVAGKASPSDALEQAQNNG